jgi:tyrosyl-tRNA synthetase
MNQRNSTESQTNALNDLSDSVKHALAVSLRGCEELIPQSDWIKKLQKSEVTKTPLRIKLGLDPTAPDIHIGHTVVLNKMRQLQDLGHTVIFLIGDFTSTDWRPVRPQQHPPAAHARADRINAQTYYRQASMVLDPAKTEIRYNSEWGDRWARAA